MLNVLLVIVKGIGPCAHLQKVSVYMNAFLVILSGGFLGETVLEKVEEIGKKHVFNVAEAAELSG